MRSVSCLMLCVTRRRYDSYQQLIGLASRAVKGRGDVEHPSHVHVVGNAHFLTVEHNRRCRVNAWEG